MPSFYQKTIKHEIQFKGVGLHNGKKVNMKLVPAAPNHGVVFKRTDLKTKNLIPAVSDNVREAILCTSIQNEFGVTVSTIEHLMGALYGEEIDNLLVELDSSEAPIMDGSAKEFIQQIRAAGTKKYDTSKKFIKVLKKCEIVIDKRFRPIPKIIFYDFFRKTHRLSPKFSKDTARRDLSQHSFINQVE